MRKLKDLGESLTSNSIVQTVAGFIGLFVIVLLIFAGAGAIGSILLVMLIGIAIYFGSIRELAGSALIAVLLKTMGGTIKSFLVIMISAPWTEQFFSLVEETGYLKLILTFFFFFYSLSFATGSIKLFRISTSVTNEQKQTDKKKQTDEKKQAE